MDVVKCNEAKFLRKQLGLRFRQIAKTRLLYQNLQFLIALCAHIERMYSNYANDSVIR